jgi:deoxyribose-phosphate aldolase
VGIKISGGIAHLQQAAQYIQLAYDIMGPDWVTANSFRIGTSKLIDEIINKHT